MASNIAKLPERPPGSIPDRLRFQANRLEAAIDGPPPMFNKRRGKNAHRSQLLVETQPLKSSTAPALLAIMKLGWLA